MRSTTMGIIAKLGRELAGSVAAFFRPSTGYRFRQCGRFRLLVGGGGPAGLAFATSLHALAGERVEITVADARWIDNRRAIRWRKSNEGVNRREQVVTLQSLVFG